jgi:hypothetical protein
MCVEVINLNHSNILIMNIIQQFLKQFVGINDKIFLSIKMYYVANLRNSTQNNIK